MLEGVVTRFGPSDDPGCFGDAEVDDFGDGIHRAAWTRMFRGFDVRRMMPFGGRAG